MARHGFYIAAYDISSDPERDRLAKVLEGYGVRVQGSVFECRLSSLLKSKLLAEVKNLNLQTGCLFLYRIKENSHREAVGVMPEEPLADSKHAWVL